MTLDEIEQLAKAVHARNASVKFGDPRYSCRVGSDELLALLLAIKRMLPVVRAAEAWRGTRLEAYADADHCERCALDAALDSLRREMGSK